MTDLRMELGEEGQAIPFAGLAHDLRNPINQIIGYSEILVEEAQGEGAEPLRRDLQRIRDAGRQLLTLVNTNFGSSQTEGFHPAEEFAVSADVEPSGLPVGSASLLVVDDNESNRDVLSRRLHRLGYAVSTAEGGQIALEMLSNRSFDLILLDVMMPGIDGFEVLRLLKGDARFQHIPVLMVSALTDLDAIVRCIDLGADDYLAKPYNPTLLNARVRASLAKKLAHDRELSLFDQLQNKHKRLEEVERMRDDLTRMIIHDLRTPLTAVISGIQTLELVGELNPDQQEVMQLAMHGGTTLLGMINDLLDVEKMESGTMQLELDMVFAEEIVESACAQVSSLVQDKQLTLVAEVPEQLPSFLGDENKLRRALVNLLANAIKFTPSGGRVTVQVAVGSELVFSVSDTGEGIPAESFTRIFEKFGQVESRKGGRSMSTGLGLTFCKLAVEAHGGKIWVESTLREESTFFIALPLDPGLS